MSDLDVSRFPTRMRGRSFEDFSVGEVFLHHWGRTLTETDNILFTTSTLAHNPIYVNVEMARAQGHPTVVINPMLVFTTVLGLSVEDLSEAGGPFLPRGAFVPRPCAPGRHADRSEPGGGRPRIRKPSGCWHRHVAQRGLQPTQ